MYSKYLLISCLVLLIWPSCGFDLDNADDIFELTTKVMHYVTSTWEIADKVEERVGNENGPLVWYTKKKERLILNNFEKITQLVHKTLKETSDLSSIMLRNLKKLENMPNAVLNGIQINELLESVRSIENDFKTMEGM